MYWYLPVIATVLGVALGYFLVWLRSRRARDRARKVGEYVDTLMEKGAGSSAAFALYSKSAGDKSLLAEFDTALDLYLALRLAQKTGDVEDMYRRDNASPV